MTTLIKAMEAMNSPTPSDGRSATAASAGMLREEFPALQQRVNGVPLVYLDNAATTQKPQAVLDAIQRFYRSDNANVHRGIHELSMRATAAYEEARGTVAAFLGISDPAELVWTRGTTDALNLVAWAYGLANLRSGDEIVLTLMEHHSNLVPWQLVAERTGARLRFIGLDAQQRLDLSTLGDVLSPRTRIVSVCHVSNALGTRNPVQEIAERAHAVGAIMVVDGAQSAAHLDVSIRELGCDFFAFSGHKVYGPTGIGGLWGRRELLEAMPPLQGGGDMIDEVQLERSTFAPIPCKFEAGTPHISGAIGLAAAVGFVSGVGRDRVLAHERHLLEYASVRLGEIPGLTLYGPIDPRERSGSISFTVAGIHPHDLATILDSHGIAIRAGHHCTQPLMRHLGLAATARASFAMYNTIEEVDALVEGIDAARAIFASGADA
jgi:cysteine desulfurase / selenocysteine lyase